MAAGSTVCSFDGCERRVSARGYCDCHYRQLLRGRPLTPARRRGTPGLFKTCSFPGCARSHVGLGYCGQHLRQLKNGSGLSPIRLHGGSRSPHSKGYVVVRNPDHPNAFKDGSMLEHVLVMSSLLGRPLAPGENVHHKNGVRDDNRPENLELWSKSQPAGQRVSDKVAWAKEILALYEPEALAK